MFYTRKTNLVIYETNDYDQFKFIVENRDVTKNKELERVIEKNDKLKYNPLIVTPDKEILDGQHRLTIAKKLGKPVYFIVDNEGDKRDVQDLNVGNKNWSMNDHLHHHAKLGNKDYKYIAEIQKNHRISLSTLLDAFCYGSRDPKNNVFKRGEMRVKFKPEEIAEALRCYDEIYEHFHFLTKKRYFTRSFQIILAKLLLHPKYDHERMMKVIKKNPDGFIAANVLTDSENIRKALLDNLYNHGLSANRIEY